MSAELPILRAQGEGLELEFKQEFPSNASKLAQEIAAFATTDGGTIILGVADDGTLIGIPGLEEASARDSLLRRVEGLCSGPVRPAVIPTAQFAQENGQTVLFIRIPRGTEPVYYCNNIPYIRTLTTSRPAEPHEVVAKVREKAPFIDQDLAQEPSAHSEILSRVAFMAVDIVVFVDELKERSVNPWLAEMEAQLHHNAGELREMAAMDETEELELVETVLALADQMEAVAGFQHALGAHSWGRFTEALNALHDSSQTFLRERLEEPGLFARTATDALARASVVVKRLEQLVPRVEERAQAGRLQDVQGEASELGNDVLRLTYLGLQHAPGLDVEELRDAARSLHLVETRRIYADGGVSFRAIQQDIKDSSARIADAVRQAAG